MEGKDGELDALRWLDGDGDDAELFECASTSSAPRGRAVLGAVQGLLALTPPSGPAPPATALLAAWQQGRHLAVVARRLALRA